MVKNGQICLNMIQCGEITFFVVELTNSVGWGSHKWVKYGETVIYKGIYIYINIYI